MIALIRFVLAMLASPFKSKSRLEAENAVFRHQLFVLRRKLKGRARLTNNDRWFFVWMYRWFPTILKVVTIVQPETLAAGPGTPSRSVVRLDLLNNLVEVHETEAERGQVILPVV